MISVSPQYIMHFEKIELPLSSDVITVKHIDHSKSPRIRKVLYLSCLYLNDFSCTHDSMLKK